MNYYPFHIGDYASHTGHLEPMEDLAYRRLLDVYYTREEALPADVQVVAKLVRMRSNVADVEAVLKEFFILGDGWVHARCDREIDKMQDKQAKARASGQASGNARRAKAEQKVEGKGTDVERTLNDRSTDAELPTPTPTPIHSVPNGTGGKPPMSTDEIIFGYGLALLTNAGTAEKQARSFLGGLRKQHGDATLIDTLRECAKAKPLQPLEWLAAALPPAEQGSSKETAFQRSSRERMQAFAPGIAKRAPGTPLTVLDEVFDVALIPGR